ncbi:MAG: ABC transporter permease [Candidatus Heimdallarchaeota archaeon]
MAFFDQQLIIAALQVTTPIALAAIGAAFCERSGVVNIAMEGLLLMGAFAAAATSAYIGNPWVGVLVAILAGMLLSAIFAVLCIRYESDQIVVGVAINLFALGFTTTMLRVIWKQTGAGDPVPKIKDLSIPLLQDLPVIGFIGRLNPLIIISLVVVPLAYILMFQTPLGLQIRAAGEHPRALDTAGVDVYRIRYIGVIISGALCGLGGAYLSIGHLNRFTKNMTTGKGFIALAANIFGKWNPVGVFGASLFFGFTTIIGLRIQQFTEIAGASYFIQMIPYLLTIAVLAGVVRRAIPPAAIGQPYKKD